MPEFDGLEIERLLGIKGLTDELRRSGDSSKAFGDNINESSRAMQSMIDTLERSKYSFGEFVSQWEKMSAVMGASIRAVNDMSMNMRGMVSSSEGLISALNTLGSRTLPELTYNLGMAASGHKQEMESLQKKIEAGKKSVAENTALANAMEAWANKTPEQIAQIQNLRQASVETTEKIEDMQEAFKKTGVAAEALGKTMNAALGWIALAVSTIVAISNAYDVATKAQREVIYTTGRLGLSYSEHRAELDKFNSSFTGIAVKWGYLREEMAKAIAPLASLGVGVGAGGAAKSIDKIKETLETSADITGGMMRGFGVEAGVTSKALGALSTTFNLDGKALGNAFADLASAGQKSVLGMQRFISETTSMIEATRRYGGSQEQAMMMTSMFGEEVKKGTISMENLAKFTTPAMWSTEQQGAVASMMTKFAPDQARALGMTGGNVLNDIYALQSNAGKKGGPEALFEGMQKILNNVVPAGAGQGERAIMQQKLLEQLTGTQIPMLEAVNAFADPTKMSTAFKGEKSMTKLMGESQITYNLIKTNAERTAVATEAMRDLMRTHWGEGALAQAIKAPFTASGDDYMTEYTKKRVHAMKEEAENKEMYLKTHHTIEIHTHGVLRDEIDRKFDEMKTEVHKTLGDQYVEAALNPHP